MRIVQGSFFFRPQLLILYPLTQQQSGQVGHIVLEAGTRSKR